MPAAARSVPEVVRSRWGRPQVAHERAAARLGHRLAGGRAAQHHKAPRGRAPRRPLGVQVARQLGEEWPIDRRHPLPAALAHHPQPPQAHVDVDQAQRADLCGPQAAQSIASAIAQSRWVERWARNASTSPGPRLSGSRRVA